MTFEIVKYNFDRGFWCAKMVGMAVKKGIITAAQYLSITGKKYTA